MLFADLLGELGGRRQMLPTVLPELYKVFTDFTSNAVRVSAIRAVGSILSISDNALPQNITDLLLRYMLDEFVVIHKAAARAAAKLKFDTHEERSEVINRLLIILAAYDKNKDELDFRVELVESLALLLHSEPPELAATAIPLLRREIAALTEGEATDILALSALEKLLGSFRYAVRSVPNASSDYLKAVVTYFRATTASMGGDFGRKDVLKSLFKIPKTVIQPFVQAIQDIALEKVLGNPADGVLVIKLLCHFELYDDVAALGAAILAKLPAVEKYNCVRDRFTAWTKLAESQVFLAAQKPTDAEKLLTAQLPLIARLRKERSFWKSRKS
jgi:hypothetical protein